MHILPLQSPSDGLLGSSQYLAVADMTSMNNRVLASFLTNASVSVGWIPRNEMVLAHLKQKSMLGKFSFLERHVHGNADPEGNGASVFHNVRI